VIYGWIGKTMLRYGLRYARRRYRRHFGILLGLLVALGGGAAAYWLKRDVPEG
jgi:hypothetical protein